MATRSVIPFGPQHPVLPEPVHLDLVVEDEHVIEAIPQIGFVHRGLEKLVEKRDYNQFVYIAERVCGICSFGHATATPAPRRSCWVLRFPAVPTTCAPSSRSSPAFIRICCGWACSPMHSALRASSITAGACARRFSISSKRRAVAASSCRLPSWAHGPRHR